MILVGYRVDCERVVDLTDPAVLSAVGIAGETLACPWEDLAARGLTPPTWELARILIAAGHRGALVPSFAPGTNTADRNLVLWRWSDWVRKETGNRAAECERYQSTKRATPTATGVLGL